MDDIVIKPVDRAFLYDQLGQLVDPRVVSGG